MKAGSLGSDLDRVTRGEGRSMDEFLGPLSPFRVSLLHGFPELKDVKGNISSYSVVTLPS